VRGVSAGEVVNLGAIQERLLRKRDRFDQAVVRGRLAKRLDSVRDEPASEALEDVRGELRPWQKTGDVRLGDPVPPQVPAGSAGTEDGDTLRPQLVRLICEERGGGGRGGLTGGLANERGIQRAVDVSRRGGASAGGLRRGNLQEKFKNSESKGGTLLLNIMADHELIKRALHTKLVGVA
jgi:hypothetical protein